MPTFDEIYDAIDIQWIARERHMEPLVELIQKLIDKAVIADRQERLGREDAYDFASMSREELVQALKNELHDIGVLVHNIAIVYDHVTGGRVSKPFTDPQAVCELADEVCNEMAEPI